MSFDYSCWQFILYQIFQGLFVPSLNVNVRSCSECTVTVSTMETKAPRRIPSTAYHSVHAPTVKTKINALGSRALISRLCCLKTVWSKSD